LVWLVVGAVTGAVASLLAKRRLMTGATTGLVGGLLGGFLGLVLIEPRGGSEYVFLPSFVCAALGGLSLVLIIALIRKAS